MTLKRFRLGDLCEMVRGAYPTLKTEPGPYPLVVTAAYRRSASSYQLQGPAVCVPLISSTGHGDAALHRVHYQEGKFALANLLVALLPKDHALCDAKYLFYFLNAKKDELFVPLMLGTANVSLKERDIAGVEVTLPPLAEQRRIVARIEALAGRIAEAKRLRKDTAKETEILSSNAFCYFVRCRSDQRVRDFVSIQNGYAFKSEWFSETGVRLVRNINIGHGRLEWGATACLPESRREEFRRFEIAEGDILISLDRPIISTGVKVARVSPTDVPSLLLQRVGRVQFTSSQVLPEYFYAWLRSSHFASAIDPGRSNGVPHISSRDIERITFTPPPIAEQRRIVSHLDAVQAKVDALHALQATTAAELDALLPAVLARAFRGER